MNIAKILDIVRSRKKAVRNLKSKSIEVRIPKSISRRLRRKKKYQ